MAASRDAVISVTSNGENARVTNRPNEVQQDASFSLRADHCLIAFADGQLAARVLYGESTMQIPVGNVVPEQLALHYQTLPI
ncbi:MAG: hypothetical protein P8L85_21820 [Rubripirellula sp.]|nr:hypothetical protein [Rubripirellula sp.]